MYSSSDNFFFLHLLWFSNRYEHLITMMRKKKKSTQLNSLNRLKSRWSGLMAIYSHFNISRRKIKLHRFKLLLSNLHFGATSDSNSSIRIWNANFQSKYIHHMCRIRNAKHQHRHHVFTFALELLFFFVHRRRRLCIAK